ncbi:RusA family crossover junction endodeoxyribonuclease [Acetobacter persici]|uniref:RusA family crossover junction endodeoxyribonuclease n=1 Tax=Acetobacter persici TaxID=1076596 RepID=UPI0039E8431C
MLSGMETAVSHPSAYRITIPGLLRAKGRPRFGNGRTFTDAKTVQAEKHIQRHAIEQIGKPCLTGPLHVSLTISIAPPPSWSRKKTADALAGRILPTSRPDIDNQMKTAADALNGIAWKDDAQIVDAILSRRYGPESMTVIEVRPL